MRFDISETLVKRLITTQFPKWSALALHPVACNGWDNTSFRLGDTLLIRLPSAAIYAAQVQKEQHWLPLLAPALPLTIPTPIAMGKPTDEYPCPWSIYRWIEGKTVAANLPEATLNRLAISLAQFIKAMQSIDTNGGPLPGAHNFFRGGPLNTYDTEIRHAFTLLKNKIDSRLASEVWETALASSWKKPAVWVHGDISPNNLLTQNGKLNAVIDFGMLSIGDPACDLIISFNLFQVRTREIFRSKLPYDLETWDRARAWALWKACIVAAGLTNTNALSITQSFDIIHEVLVDHTSRKAY